MSTSLSSRVTSIQAAQRKLIVGAVVAALAALAIAIFDLASGGRPDPPALRAAAVLLGGPWRFHTGDDPRWADATTDDSDWERIDMTPAPGSHDSDVGLPDYVSGWMAHGHPGYRGYAWYRRTVAVPAGPGAWDILGPSLVDHAYELYWNGRLLGGSGRLGPAPRLVGTRPLRFALPADAAGATGVIAVRAYMSPRSKGGATAGGMHSAPLLAPRPIGEALHRAHWRRTIAGYIVDAIEPIAMAALIGLMLWRRSFSERKGFLVFAGVALALTAIRRSSNALTSWTDLEDLTTYAWIARWLSAPTVAAWALAWNRWSRPPWRTLDVAALGLAVAGTIGPAIHSSSVTSASRLASIALFVVIGLRIARSGPAQILALVTLASIVAAVFGGELLDPMHVPGIWFPFGIGVSRTQYVYAIAIPLLAILVVRTLGPKRLASDPIQAAER
jgi:hypothetical protein